MKYFLSNTYPIELVLTENLDVEYPAHNHVNHWVLSMLLCGNAVLKSAGVMHRLCAGEHFVLPPYMPHSLSLNSKTRMLSLCIHKELFAHCGFSELKDAVCDCLENTRAACALSSEQKMRFIGFMQELTELAERTKSNSVLCDCNSVLRDSKAPDMIKFAEMMADEPENEYALESIAKTFRIDKFNLVKKFKRHFGLPPHQFLIQSRVRKAQRLLCRSVLNEMTLADISAYMGFYDQSHFDKAFGKIVGISPREYMKSLDILF